MKTLHYAIVLGLICAIAAFGVAGSYRMTRERIVEKSIADEESARSEVIGVSGCSKRIIPLENDLNGFPCTH